MHQLSLISVNELLPFQILLDKVHNEDKLRSRLAFLTPNFQCNPFSTSYLVMKSHWLVFLSHGLEKKYTRQTNKLC